MMGERDKAHQKFESLLGLRNDVGLLAEEHDAVAGRQVGSFPQAFSHVPLIDTACNLTVGELAAQGAAPAGADLGRPEPCPRF